MKINCLMCVIHMRGSDVTMALPSKLIEWMGIAEHVKISDLFVLIGYIILNMLTGCIGLLCMMTAKAMGATNVCITGTIC